MTPEIRAAAERLMFDPFQSLTWQDVHAVAGYVLAEHPAGDHEPLDEAWLGSVGFVPCGEPGEYRSTEDHDLRFQIQDNGSCSCWIEGYSDMPQIENRGSLRRLCQALGIPMKEQP